MVAADPASSEQVVLVEIYRQIIALDGQDVVVAGPSMPSSGDRLDVLLAKEADLAVMCVGELVTDANPGEAGQLLRQAKEHEGTTNDDELDLATYDAAVATLPADLMTLDPSPAHGCGAEEGEGLPQNVIPVFKTGLFDRGVRSAMSQVTRALNTGDLEDMVADVESGEDPAATVNTWMKEETGMGAELERIVEEGEARDS